MIDLALVRKLIANLDAKTLRELAAILLGEAVKRDGTSPPVMIQWGDELLTTDEAEVRRRQEIADRGNPHNWIDLAPGTGGQAGDNDAPDDELFRTHGPFMKAATDLGWKDSTGQRFTVQTVKKRANEIVGFGKPAWAYVRSEVRRLQLTPEGYAWMNDPANLAAGIVPRGLA